MRLVVHRPRGVSSSRLAAWSRGSLDVELGGDARLVVAVPADEAVVVGAFQRRSEVEDASAFIELPVYRRASGGGAVRVGPGSLWIQLALPSANALVPCDPPRVLNRYVRPLLRALQRVAPASYFGRDWVSVAHRPGAAVGFAHDAASGRVLFEAIVAVTTPLVPETLRGRPSFLGKEPATLAELRAGAAPSELGAITPEAIASAVTDAYAALAPSVPIVSLVSPPLEEALVEEASDGGAAPEAATVVADPPWAATALEAIGVVGAGRDAAGRMRVGGELMASRDAIAALEDALARGEAAAAAVDGALTAPNVVVFGVRSLATIADVIARATAGR